jgi:hypothetical protein
MFSSLPTTDTSETGVELSPFPHTLLKSDTTDTTNAFASLRMRTLSSPKATTLYLLPTILMIPVLTLLSFLYLYEAEAEAEAEGGPEIVSLLREIKAAADDEQSLGYTSCVEGGRYRQCSTACACCLFATAGTWCAFVKSVEMSSSSSLSSNDGLAASFPSSSFACR